MGRWLSLEVGRWWLSRRLAAGGKLPRRPFVVLKLLPATSCFHPQLSHDFRLLLRHIGRSIGTLAEMVENLVSWRAFSFCCSHPVASGRASSLPGGSQPVGRHGRCRVAYSAQPEHRSEHQRGHIVPIDQHTIGGLTPVSFANVGKNTSMFPQSGQTVPAGCVRDLHHAWLTYASFTPKPSSPATGVMSQPRLRYPT